MLKVRLLVVDDSLTIRAMIEEIFGHDRDILVVGTAASAQEAHDMIAALHPAVMTLDIEMPGINGLDFLTTVMRETPMPIVMISSQTPRHAPVREEAKRRGAVACLNKANIVRDAEIFCRVVKKAAQQEVHMIMDVPPAAIA